MEKVNLQYFFNVFRFQNLLFFHIRTHDHIYIHNNYVMLLVMIIKSLTLMIGVYI